MKKNELKIEYVPIEMLEPYANNTRKHEQFDVDQIAKSIDLYGFNNPIAIWSDHNVIVSGHGRVIRGADAINKLMGMRDENIG